MCNTGPVDRPLSTHRSTPMTSFASRMAALLLAALAFLACSPAFAATVFDNLADASLTEQFNDSTWVANRLPARAEPVRIQAVAVTVGLSGRPIALQVCRDTPQGNAPDAGTCASFSTGNPNGYGPMTYTGSLDVPAGEAAWVVLHAAGSNQISLQYWGLGSWDGLAWRSTDAGATWTFQRNTTLGMAVTGAVAVPPVLAAVTPQLGPTAGGTPVVVTGRALDTVHTVTFGGTPAAFTVQGDGQLTATAPAHAAGRVVLALANAFGTSPAAYDYLDQPAPQLEGVQPAQGPLAGADIVLTGRDFHGVTGVYFGPAGSRVPAAAYAVADSGRITVRAPAAAAAGTVRVWVDTAYGQTSVIDPGFTYLDAPTLAAVSPALGPVGGGTQITLQGAALAATTAVRVGGAAAAFTVDSDSQVRATTPPGAAGQADVALDTPGGTATRAGAFLYLAPAALTGVQPAVLTAQGGQGVTLTGSGFTGASAVTFGGLPAASFTVLSDTQIHATTPALPAGPVAVVVVAPAGTVTAGATAQAAPTITGLAPPSGPAAGGQVLAVGSGFSHASAITFGGVPALAFTVLNDTTLDITAPAHAPGRVALQVTTPGGSASADYTYLPPAPTLSAISPASGPLAGGTQVTLTGQHLGGTLAVSFGGRPATGLAVVSDTSVSATAPAGAAAGSVAVTLTTLGGSATAAQPFTYLGATALTQAAPASGATAGGTQVTLTGQGLLGATQVTFGGEIASFTVVSDTRITATAPPHAAGAVAIAVATPQGSAAWSGSYRYLDAPAVTGLAPAQGPAAGGTQVTLTGSGFTDASAVTFGGEPGTGLAVAHDGSLSVAAPAHAPGAVEVRVTTPGGSASAAQAYTYVAAPTLAAAAPATAATAGGTPVALTGAHLAGASAVTFGGVPAAGFTVVSDTRITATAPAHAAGPVDVAVTTPGGTATLAGALSYAVALDGACGAAQDQPHASAPRAGLCASGQASAVQAAPGSWTWSCAGDHGGQASGQCRAPWAGAGAGQGAVQTDGAHGWQIGSAAFDPAALPAPLPAGARSAHAPLALALQGGAPGSAARVTVRYTEPVPAGAVYLKYGPSREGLGCSGAAACARPHWYALPGAQFAPDRLSVAFTLTDGGDGDSDGVVDGRITDPGLPVVLAAAPGGPQPIPALGPGALALLAALLGLLGLRWRRG